MRDSLAEGLFLLIIVFITASVYAVNHEKNDIMTHQEKGSNAR